MRWTVSMVAEVHRILIRGGVFLYPIDADNGAAGGKLWLLYDVIPMAMIVEAAGCRLQAAVRPTDVFRCSMLEQFPRCERTQH